MSSVPTIMVSSTFYDLRQIRADLAQFIADDLGYVPLLSELPSFPVNPDLNTVENCRLRVEQNADILILVVGGRYGSIDDATDISITNLEFLAARQKGIPVYAFVEKGIISVLPVWERNPDGDFSSVVDTLRLFKFVEHVRRQERVWTFPFEGARDIINTLRMQFAHLFHDALRVRLRLSGNELPRYFDSLGPRSLRIALEKPQAWEYRLLFQSWIDEIEHRVDLAKEYRGRLTLGSAEFVSAPDAPDWLRTRLHELEGLVTSGNQLINVSAQKAFGPPGEPGDAEEITWVSRMLGIVYENALLWARRIRCSMLEEPFEGMGTQLALFIDDLIAQFETFPTESLKTIEEGLASTDPAVRKLVELTLTFQLSNLDGFQRTIESAHAHYKSGAR